MLVSLFARSKILLFFHTTITNPPPPPPSPQVQFVVGYGEAGSALVTSGVDKIIFVGSPEVGAIVARTASANLTPVVLELGGKDPFVVCDDVDVDSIVQTACR